MHNHFELFGLAPAYRIDLGDLDRAYRELQHRVHPDRHVRAGDAGRRASIEWATRVNEAYRVLRDPVRRASHLLALRGIDVGFESNTAMPTDFLEQQMTLREALEAARDTGSQAALDAVGKTLREARRRLEAGLAERLDGGGEDVAAAGDVRKLMFLNKLGADLDAAFERLDGG